MFGLTVASLIYVLFVLPVAITDYAISTEWYELLYYREGFMTSLKD